MDTFRICWVRSQPALALSKQACEECILTHSAEIAKHVGAQLPLAEAAPRLPIDLASMTDLDELQQAIRRKLLLRVYTCGQELFKVNGDPRVLLNNGERIAAGDVAKHALPNADLVREVLPLSTYCLLRGGCVVRSPTFPEDWKKGCLLFNPFPSYKIGSP